MEWYLKPWRKYADFSGRARRKEYWTFSLVNFLIMFPMVFYVRLKGLEDNITGIVLIVLIAFLLATIIPNLALTVRRLHDTNRIGWYYFISFIPSVGNLILLIFMFLDGSQGENDYGPDPKGREYTNFNKNLHPLDPFSKDAFMEKDIDSFSHTNNGDKFRVW